MTDPNRIERGTVTWERWNAYGDSEARPNDFGHISVRNNDAFELTPIEMKRFQFVALADALIAEGRRQEREAQAATYWADGIKG